ncbi:MAG: hypothetical protein CSA81_03380 [Acidobacteria bacterium]|nr:MAG: hypothetical protein CSA81_03380 [Acidobacteriota bacterium]
MPHQTILKSTALKALYPPGTAIEDLPLYLQKLLYPLGYYDQVEKEAVYSRIDPLLLESIIREETHFNAVAKSGASARGLMQFIPETARRTSLKRFPNQLKPRLEDLYNPEFSISLGAAFLSQLQESFGYMSLYSIAAYNAGEGAVEKWKSLGITHDGKNNQVAYDPLLFIFDVTYSETKRYCQKVLATYYQYRRIYALKDSYPKGFVTRLGNAGESYYLKSSS